MKKVLLFFWVTPVLAILSCSDLLNTDAQRAGPPSGITLYAPDRVLSTGFTVRWNRTASRQFAAYHLYCDTNSVPSDSSPYVYKTLYRDDTSYTFTSLPSATTWNVRARVYNSMSFFESNEITVTTSACSCGSFSSTFMHGMALIPAGCYSDSAGYEVTISRDFFMDTVEVTEAQWAEIMHPDSPVVSLKPRTDVSWYQILLYCNKKSVRMHLDTCYSFSSISYDTLDGSIAGISDLRCDFQKRGFRLPTEDEWEYTYRAGVPTDFYWGKNSSVRPRLDSIVYPLTPPDSQEISNYEWWRHAANIMEVQEGGVKRSNPWHLYDLGGNVREFVWNAWDAFSPRLRSNRLDYSGKSTPASAERVTRGGAYFSGSECLSANYRMSWWPPDKNWAIGFRLVRTSL
ncbi:MAG: formylglycine-generating enzyme family protein [Chitinispirillaceae bacterium]|nr:formylglycine-generating enzyme family protein [Chitinispirillaceae bacterium]